MDAEDEQIEYNIILGRDEPREVIPGLKELGRELQGARFGKSGNTGVADSVQAVQKANLLQVPPYAIVAGRGVAAREEPTWQTFVDTLGERLTLDVKAGQYDGIDAGVYVVDLIGAGLFMPRHDVIRAAVINNQLVRGAIKIEPKYKNLLLKEKSAYRWDGREVENVAVQVFDSYDAFLEASTGADFDQGLRDMTAVYAVIRPVDEAQKNPSAYRSIDVQSNNPDGIIPSGGRAPWQRMLGQMKSFGWENVGSRHDGYTNVDTGRPVVLRADYSGVLCLGNLISLGGSVGVAPEALKARNAARKTSLDMRVDTALTRGQSFEYNGKLYVPVQTNSNVQLIK